MEDAQAAGKVRVIGVSNFLIDDLESLMQDCRVKPMVNQILLHIIFSLYSAENRWHK